MDNIEEKEETKRVAIVQKDEEGNDKIVRYAEGEEAEEILSEAKKQGKEIVKDSDLTEKIAKNEKDDLDDKESEIYDRLSLTVSEICNFVEELDQIFGKEKMWA